MQLKLKLKLFHKCFYKFRTISVEDSTGTLHTGCSGRGVGTRASVSLYETEHAWYIFGPTRNKIDDNNPRISKPTSSHDIVFIPNKLCPIGKAGGCHRVNFCSVFTDIQKNSVA